jgi:hypothetical protein
LKFIDITPMTDVTKPKATYIAIVFIKRNHDLPLFNMPFPYSIVVTFAPRVKFPGSSPTPTAH